MIQLLAIQKQEKPKTAMEHFKKCPACAETNLIHSKPEVLCSRCDWTSCSWSVSRGTMDNLFKAAVEEMRITHKIEKDRLRGIETKKPPTKSVSAKIANLSDAS